MGISTSERHRDRGRIQAVGHIEAAVITTWLSRVGVLDRDYPSADRPGFLGRQVQWGGRIFHVKRDGSMLPIPGVAAPAPLEPARRVG